MLFFPFLFFPLTISVHFAGASLALAPPTDMAEWNLDFLFTTAPDSSLFCKAWAISLARKVGAQWTFPHLTHLHPAETAHCSFVRKEKSKVCCDSVSFFYFFKKKKTKTGSVFIFLVTENSHYSFWWLRHTWLLNFFLNLRIKNK